LHTISSPTDLLRPSPLGFSTTFLGLSFSWISVTGARRGLVMASWEPTILILWAAIPSSAMSLASIRSGMGRPVSRQRRRKRAKIRLKTPISAE
jgi:hypothetical protein